MSAVSEEVDAAYARSCSDRTLWSEVRGFFGALAEEAVAVASRDDWLTRVFGKAGDDASRLRAVYDNAELMSSLSAVLSRVRPLSRGKDAVTSRERREEVRAALDQGHLRRALGLATQAVIKAPATGSVEEVDGGVSLALALWLRSEVLLKMERPHAALEDLRAALKERLPARIRPHYYWRMGHCYKGVGEPSKAKVSYELAERLVGAHEEARSQLRRDIACLEPASTQTSPESAQTSAESTTEGIKVTGGSRLSLHGLSKLVRIAEDASKGRFAVADARIKTGDVVLVEAPYAACLLPDRYGTHCLHCFNRLEQSEQPARSDLSAPVPCGRCSSVAFCSRRCRDAAFYHQYECPYTDLFIGSGMSILSHIAVRMVTQAGLETSLTLHRRHLSCEPRTGVAPAPHRTGNATDKDRANNRKERLNRTKRGIKILESNGKEEDVKTNVDKEDEKENLSLKAAQIYSLCTHSELRKPEDSLKRIVMAMFLTRCLTNAEFFGKTDPAVMVRDIQAIQELILRNLQLLQFNAHELYETLRGQHRFSGSKCAYVAVGIYPTGALFNHECYPAVARYFEGKKIVLRATRPLDPGEVVSENYGPHFLVRSRRDRQRVLAARYWFRCGCAACDADWPALRELTDVTLRLRCPNKECRRSFEAGREPRRCPECDTPLDPQTLAHNAHVVRSCVSEYQKAAKYMEEENPAAAISCICPSIDLFCSVAAAPHRETHLAQESLRACYATFGNVHVLPPDTPTHATPT